MDNGGWICLKKKKERKAEDHYTSIHLQKWRKEHSVEQKESGRKKIIKKIIQWNSKQIIEKTNKEASWFIEKPNKINAEQQYQEQKE